MNEQQGDRECPECLLDTLVESSLCTWKCLKCSREFEEDYLDDGGTGDE